MPLLRSKNTGIVSQLEGNDTKQDLRYRSGSMGDSIIAHRTTAVSQVLFPCSLGWATSPSSSYELLGLVAQPLFTVSPTRITGAGVPGTPGPDPQTPDPRESL